MSEIILAYCGLLCNECPLLIATRNNDQNARRELAKQCSSDRCTFEPEDMNCQGCFKVDPAQSKMCSDCAIRACAVQKPVKHCAECGHFPCPTYDTYIPADSKERARLTAAKADQ